MTEADDVWISVTRRQLARLRDLADGGELATRRAAAGPKGRVELHATEAAQAAIVRWLRLRLAAGKSGPRRGPPTFPGWAEVAAETVRLRESDVEMLRALTPVRLSEAHAAPAPGALNVAFHRPAGLRRAAYYAIVSAVEAALDAAGPPADTIAPSDP